MGYVQTTAHLHIGLLLLAHLTSQTGQQRSNWRRQQQILASAVVVQLWLLTVSVEALL